jgi:hypothetical protein
MQVRRRPAVAATLTLCAVLVSAGCAESRGPEVATAKSPAAVEPEPAAASASAQRRGRDYDKALQYTRCMNEHGERMDDPVEGKPLPLMSDDDRPEKGFALVPEAFEKCRHLMPATWPVKPDPKFAALERRWGACMREQGIAYPEPDANGMVHHPTDPSAMARPEYQAADAACRHVIEDAAGSGTGE